MVLLVLNCGRHALIWYTRRNYPSFAVVVQGIPFDLSFAGEIHHVLPRFH